MSDADLIHGLSVDLFSNATAIPSDQWVQVGVVGQWEGHAAGGYRLTPVDLKSMVDFFNQRYRANNADLVVDYAHQSLVLGQEAPAAGWIKKMEMRKGDTELWARVRWNDRASDLISRREFRFISPVFRFKYADPVTGRKWPAALDSAALTNKPFLTELPAIVNQNQAVTEANPPGSQSSTQEVQTMGLLAQLAAALGKDAAAVAQMLGIGADADDGQVIAAIVTRLNAGAEAAAKAAEVEEAAKSVQSEADYVTKAAEEVVEAAGEAAEAAKEVAAVPAETTVAVIANALGFTPDTKPEILLRKLAELKGQAADTQAERLVANAVAAGKIQPSLKPYWIGQARKDFRMTEAVVNSMTPILGAASNTGGAPPNAEETDPEKIFANSADLQAEFSSLESYKAFLKAETEGRVKLVRKI